MEEDEALASLPRALSAQQRFVAAMAGSALTAIVVTPLDVVKTRLQAQVQPAVAASTTSAAATAARQRHLTTAAHRLPAPAAAIDGCCGGDFVFCHNAAQPCPPATQATRITGTLDGIVKIARHEGISALWRGLPPSLIMAVPATSLYFVAYETIRADLDRRSAGAARDYTPLVAGASARSLVAALVSPLELMKTRLQSDTQAAPGRYRRVLVGVSDMVRASGASSLWRGLSPTLWRDVPFSAFYWFSYEQIKAALAARVSHWRPGYGREFSISFYAGALAGGAAAALTTPFDVAKTRRQLDQGEGSSRLLAALQRIVADDGWRGLFRGLAPRVLRTAPACAIMIGSYEVGKVYFTETNRALATTSTLRY